MAGCVLGRTGRIHELVETEPLPVHTMNVRELFRVLERNKRPGGC